MNEYSSKRFAFILESPYSEQCQSQIRDGHMAPMAFRSVDSHLEGAYEPSKRVALGIVVPDMATARRLRYDVLTLIDQGLVSEAQFDHILVYDQLPASLEGLDE